MKCPKCGKKAYLLSAAFSPWSGWECPTTLNGCSYVWESD